MGIHFQHSINQLITFGVIVGSVVDEFVVSFFDEMGYSNTTKHQVEQGSDDGEHQYHNYPRQLGGRVSVSI